MNKVNELVYFDNAATTRIDPSVLEDMRPFLEHSYGNPSSSHQLGRMAKVAIDEARQRLADLLHADSREIIFTAGATEANNLVLLGLSEKYKNERPHFITSSIEHPSVLETCRHLERQGVAISYLPCDQDGLIAPSDLAEALRPNTKLISIMAANNVVGTVQPILEFAEIANRAGILFHTDASQAVGRIPLDLSSNKIDLLSCSAHKIYGPKGVGALYVRKGVQISPIIYGGGQEGGYRSGTENVAGIVGFGKAAQIANTVMADESVRLVSFREKLIETITSIMPIARVVGHRWRRLPGHISLRFSGLENEAIRVLLALDQAGIAVSSGSACSSNHVSDPSYVLQAMGYNPMQARGSLRISLGRFNNELECDYLLSVLPQIISTLNPVTTKAHDIPSHFPTINMYENGITTAETINSYSGGTN